MPKKFVDSAAPPLADPPLLGSPAPLSVAWQKWFQAFPSTFASIVNKINTVTLSTQEASIAATPIQDEIIAAGNYRITYCMGISRAASASSSLKITIGWTHDGVSHSYSGSTLIGNAPTTHESNTQMIRADAGSDVTYSTTYSSNGATSMQYHLDLLFERVRVDRT